MRCKPFTFFLTVSFFVAVFTGATVVYRAGAGWARLQTVSKTAKPWPAILVTRSVEPLKRRDRSENVEQIGAARYGDGDSINDHREGATGSDEASIRPLRLQRMIRQFECST